MPFAEPPDGETSAPASYGQEQLWLLDRMAPGQTTYNVTFDLRVTGQLELEVLEAALGSVVARHPSLRSAFRLEDGQLHQVIAPPGPLVLAVTDLSTLPPDQRDAALARLLGELAATPFDLDAHPLYRFHAVRLAPDLHVLHLAFHHAVTDGWSSGIVFADLSEAYGALLAGEIPGGTGPGAPEVTYADYATAQRQRPEALDDELAFWERYLADLPTLDMPVARSRPVSPTHAGEVVHLPGPAGSAAALGRYCATFGGSPFTVLATATSVALGRYCRADDIPLGVTMLGREDPDIEGVVGLFATMVVLRTDLTGNPTFGELAQQVAESVVDLVDHQDVPFERVVERLNPPRVLGRNPLFQVALQVLDERTSGGTLVIPGAAVEHLAASASRARFDITVTFVLHDDDLRADVEYSTELYDRWQIEAFVEQILVVALAGCKDPGRRVAALPLLTPDAAAAVLALGRGEEPAPHAVPVHRLIEEVASEHPSLPALRCQGRAITYDQLVARGRAVARQLRRAGVGPEQIVAIAMERDIDTVAAMVGTLMAGAAYATVDPAHPPARIAHVLADTATPVLLTRPEHAATIPAPEGCRILVLDEAWQAEAERDPAARRPIDDGATVDSLAYVIYTSGSTGQPKGTLVEHQALACFLQAYAPLSRLGPDQRMLQLFAITFDMSQGEIYTALTTGATLVLVPPADARDPSALCDMLREERITHVGLSPALLSVLDPDPYPDLRFVMSGGEALSVEALQRWHLPGRRFVNMYGPTEAAVACVHYECPPGVASGPPPIGRPEPHRALYVVDPTDGLLPPGVPGELLVGGQVGLARGYLNQPALTAERFVHDPFRPGGRAYRTGDLVKWDGDGNLVFLGRIDRQVQFHGLRIELGEIESALCTHPAVRSAVVMLRHDPGRGEYLAAYLATPDPEGLRVEDVRHHIAKLLPEYMLPTAWVPMAALPLTVSAKVDRAALPVPPDPGATENHQAPATATEAALVSIYCEVLGLDEVGTGANFFEIGGTSLQAMQVVNRIKKAFTVKLAMRAFYGAPTLADVARAVDELRTR